MNYIVVASNDLMTFEGFVSQKIMEGYQPLNAFFVIEKQWSDEQRRRGRSDPQRTYYQPMVRVEVPV